MFTRTMKGGKRYGRGALAASCTSMHQEATPPSSPTPAQPTILPSSPGICNMDNITTSSLLAESRSLANAEPSSSTANQVVNQVNQRQTMTSKNGFFGFFHLKVHLAYTFVSTPLFTNK